MRVLDDSVSDYARLRGTTANDVRQRMDRDIDAVIKLYNSVAGSRLVLERGNTITGDKDLQDTGKDDFSDQTIVIGFTNGTFNGTTSAEAGTNRNPEKCTITRAHVRFRKNDDDNKRPFVWGLWATGPLWNNCESPTLRRCPHSTADPGSKRIQGKNVRPLRGHPLIAYTIAAARASGIFSDVIVSTDSDAYAEDAKHYGTSVPFLRPPEFAGDLSPDIEWIGTR